MARVAAYLDTEGDADDLILLTDTSVRHPFEYYFAGSNETHTRVAVPDTLSGDRIRDRVRGYDTVWLVASNADGANVARFTGVIGTDYSFAETRNYRGINVVEFRNRSTATRPANETANATDSPTPTPTPTPAGTATPDR